MDVPLHLLEPHGATLFALEVVDDSSQRLEVLAARAVGAVVEVLLVSRRVQMLIQPVHRSEPPVAQITLPHASVPGPVGAAVRVLGAALPPDELLGDQARRVLGPYELVDGVAVQRGGVPAAAALQVVCHARGGGVAVGAEGALDVLAAMDAGVEVLSDTS